MLGWYLRLLLASAAVATLAACPGPSQTKTVKKNKKTKKADQKALVSEARDDAKNGDYDAADSKYAEAYDISKDFDVLEERVDFLIHAGRATKAAEAAKAYLDANVSDKNGYILYAEALLAGNKGEEALEVSDQLIQLNADEPAGYEKKGRALILLEKNEEGLDMLRKAVQMDPKSAAFHRSLGSALNKLGKIDESALEFQAAIKADPDDAEAHVLLGM